MVCEKDVVARAPQGQERVPRCAAVRMDMPRLDDLREVPRTSLVALVLANLVPLVGVIAFGWDLGLVLLLYWGESAVIFVFSIAKMVRVAGKASFLLVPFFLVHAGMFMGGHLVFLLALFVDRPAAGWSSWFGDLGIGLAALFASHLVSFLVNVRGRGESYKAPQDAMSGFYGRIVVMHLTIIFGAFLGAIIGFRIAALTLLIVLKTAADAFAHARERRKNQPAPDVAPVQPEPS